MLRSVEGVRKPSEPVDVGAAIVVGKGEDVAGAHFGSVIARGGEAAGFEMESADVFGAFYQFFGAVG